MAGSRYVASAGAELDVITMLCELVQYYLNGGAHMRAILVKSPAGDHVLDEVGRSWTVRQPGYRGNRLLVEHEVDGRYKAGELLMWVFGNLTAAAGELIIQPDGYRSGPDVVGSELVVRDGMWRNYVPE